MERSFLLECHCPDPDSVGVRRIDSDFPLVGQPRGDPFGECINQSKSGDGRRPGLERGMQRAEIRELGASGQVQKLDRLRHLQERRCGEQEIVGKRNDGADCTDVGRMPVVVVIGGLLLLNRVAGRIKRGVVRGVGKTGIREADLDVLRGSDPVAMSERQRELDNKREQRQPRASSDVVSKPSHNDVRLARPAESFDHHTVTL